MSTYSSANQGGRYAAILAALTVASPLIAAGFVCFFPLFLLAVGTFLVYFMQVQKMEYQNLQGKNKKNSNLKP